MGLAVVSVAAGGMPVVDVTSIAPRTGTPVTEATNGRGVRVTKVIGKPGLPVVFETIGVAPAVTYATFDPATVTAVTLSGGNLVATNTGTTSADQGARVAAAGGKTSGKYYFEMAFTTLTGGGNVGLGIATTSATYTNMGNTATGGVECFRGGSVYNNGGGIVFSFAPFSSGAVIGIALDLDNRKVWFKKVSATPGEWNNNATYNPATNVGGVVVLAGTMVPLITFGGSGGLANNVMTANFGASAFVGAVPSGFTSGWPA